MKWFFIIIIVVLIVVGAFYGINKYSVQKKLTTKVYPSPSAVTTISPVNPSFQVIPISHATMVLHLAGQVIYTDPVGGKAVFGSNPPPTIILITHTHPDHFNIDTLKAVETKDTILVVPQAAANLLPKDMLAKIVVMKNNDVMLQNGIGITAIPMYSVPPTAITQHVKGEGNGYILEADGQRIYIAGDSDDTPEMKALKNIDVAFVPMNPPYTMSVERAAAAVLTFKPKVVHPYHYRTPTGFADINKFKQLVESGDPNIKVELLNFYPHP